MSSIRTLAYISSPALWKADRESSMISRALGSWDPSGTAGLEMSDELEMTG
ncbi:MAG: hypothetical protein GWO17_18025 [Gemmatimonadetes bacterium]|nr:hypothetical protein [Gemmatimonadota bacterium]